MDINENEDQLQEVEPLSSDPQPAPEPEQDLPEEEVQAGDPAGSGSVPEEDQEDEDEGEAVDLPTLEPAPLEFLEELPVMEAVAEQEVEIAEDSLASDLEQDEVEVLEESLEAEDDLPEMEEDLPEVEEDLPEVDDDLPEMEDDLPAVKADLPEVEKSHGKPAVDPYASVTVHEDPVAEDGRAWYVIHCYSGNEDKVRHNILQRIESMSMDDLIFDVVVPTEDEVNIKNGERQTIEKKVFPGYILVYMILTEESWYMVRNTPGVTGFVGMGNDPTALQPEEVARILKRMESESPRINVTFRPGERVRIVDGPFEDFYGKVSEIDMDRATVRVMVNFFGRETPVELDFLQVEEA